MYLALKHETTRMLTFKRAWALQNKTKEFDFSFSARLRESIHVSGSRGIRIHYTLEDFDSENLTLPERETGLNKFEFVLTEAGAVSSDGPHKGHLADIAEDLRCAWLTPEIGISGLCWKTQPTIHSKLSHPLRTFHGVAEHRITKVLEQSITIESLADVSIKLAANVRMGPLHGSSKQTTVLHKTTGPQAMNREVKVILHDPDQSELFPAQVQSTLSMQ